MVKLVLFSVILCVLIVVLVLPFCFLSQVSQTEIEDFVQKNEGAELASLEISIPAFFRDNIKSSWNQTTDYLEIDQELFNSNLDCWVMEFLGINRADIIVYQELGSCGQTAIVIDQILFELGYDSAKAKFTGVIDHAWAEVKNDAGKWQIVDPYIGFFVNIKDLSADIRFQNASGVTVQFRNGTIIDMSKEHGYD